VVASVTKGISPSNLGGNTMLRIYEVCRQMVIRVHRLVEIIKQHDPKLADQLNPSSRSVKDAVAEGSGLSGNR
jgi:hypothetical protein